MHLSSILVALHCPHRPIVPDNQRPKLSLTGRRAVRYAQERDKARCFINLRTVLSLWGLVGAERATFSGSGEPSLATLSSRGPSKWRDRRMIPYHLINELN